MQIVQNFRTWSHGISPTTGSNNSLTDSTSHLSGMEDHWIPKYASICINMHQYASICIPTWKPLNTYCHCASNCQHLLANLSLCQAPASNLLIPFEWTNGCYTFALQPWLDASHRWKWPQQEDPSSRPKNRKHPQNPPKLDRVFHHVHSCSPSKWISCFFSTHFFHYLHSYSWNGIHLNMFHHLTGHVASWFKNSWTCLHILKHSQPYLNILEHT